MASSLASRYEPGHLDLPLQINLRTDAKKHPRYGCDVFLHGREVTPKNLNVGQMVTFEVGKARTTGEDNEQTNVHLCVLAAATSGPACSLRPALRSG